MDWQFIRDLLTGVFTFSGNIIQSILAYIGILSFFYLLFPKLEGKMKDRLVTLRHHKLNILLSFLLASIILTSYNLYENKRVIWATAPELQAPYLSNRNIKMWELASTGNPIISSRVFENCEFYGPAVVSIRPNCVGDLAITTLEGVTIDTALIPTTNEKNSGIFIFDNCVFKGVCKLNNVSIIGSTELIEKMKADLRESLGGSNVATK